MEWHVVGFPVGQTAQKYHLPEVHELMMHDTKSTCLNFLQSFGAEYPFLDKAVVSDKALGELEAILTSTEWIKFKEKHHCKEPA